MASALDSVRHFSIFTFHLHADCIAIAQRVRRALHQPASGMSLCSLAQHAHNISDAESVQVMVGARELNAEETAARELKMKALFGVGDDD
jgi:hypothetical protein